MKPIHVKRLKKLIAFLRKLPRKRFNFAIVRNEPPKCGAVGCAIGYMPNVFPRVFKSYFRSHVDASEVLEGVEWTHGVGFRMDGYPSFEDTAEWVCGLPYHKAGLLFSPGGQLSVDDDLPNLSDNATPKQVAAMLEKFIKLQTAKK